MAMVADRGARGKRDLKLTGRMLEAMRAAMLLRQARGIGPVGDYLVRCFGDFDFEGRTCTRLTAS